jgi:hypothetical protein
VKKTGRGKSVGAVIYICMGTTQGSSLCSYLYLKLAKHHVSCFIFYVFPSTKSENRRVEQVLPRGRRRRGSGWHRGRGEVGQKWVGG